MTPSVDIILPVYNEEEGLAAFHEALSTVLAGLSQRYAFRVIYVLDRCRDNSLAVLKGIASGDARVMVIHLSRRFGHQMSLIAGLDHSNADASILMDCDMQHPPQLIEELLAKMEQGYDVVQAIRTYDPQIQAGKQWTSHIFYKIQNWLSRLRFPMAQPISAWFLARSERSSRHPSANKISSFGACFSGWVSTRLQWNSLARREPQEALSMDF